MNIYTHKIMFGINKGKTVESLANTLKDIEGLKWYKKALENNLKNPYYKQKNLEIIKGLDEVISTSIFKFKYKELENILILFHDEKAKDPSFINKDYLDYLALKNTNKTIDEIIIDKDTNALEKIIQFLNEMH